MKPRIIGSIVAAAAILSLFANPSAAADDRSGNTPTPSAAGKPSVAQKSATAKKPPAKVKLVDINSASKAELKTLSGVGDAEADKIIAGRPHLTKANLVTQKILPAGVYQQIKNRIVARQKTEPTPKTTGKSR